MHPKQVTMSKIFVGSFPLLSQRSGESEKVRSKRSRSIIPLPDSTSLMSNFNSSFNSRFTEGRERHSFQFCSVHSSFLIFSHSLTLLPVTHTVSLLIGRFPLLQQQVRKRERGEAPDVIQSPLSIASPKRLFYSFRYSFPSFSHSSCFT